MDKENPTQCVFDERKPRERSMTIHDVKNTPMKGITFKSKSKYLKEDKNYDSEINRLN